MKLHRRISLVLAAPLAVLALAAPAQVSAQQKPNVVMLMTDDTGWNDFGAYSGGGMSLGHPNPENPVPSLDKNNMPKAISSE